MSTEKITAEDVEPLSADPADQGPRPEDTAPGKAIDVLALEVEEDDFGGDPYNRTGQYCVIELKNREQ